MTRRRRRLLASAVALVAHGALALYVFSARPLPLHSYVKGSIAPTYLHMTVVESAHKGAVVAPARVPLAPKERTSGDELVGEPEHPRPGLWVLHMPVESAPRPAQHVDAGPQ